MPSGVAWLIQLVVFALLAPALLAAHAMARAASAGQPVPRGGALVAAALRVWRGNSFRIGGASGIATTAPLLAAATALGAGAIVPGFCRGLPIGGLADPVILAALLLATEAAPVLAALAVGTSATGAGAIRAAQELLPRFAALLLASLAISAVAGGDLDASLTDATPTVRAILLAAALIAVMQAAEALRGEPGLLAELGGPDLLLLRWAAAARAAALLTLARYVTMPWLWAASVPDPSAVARWPLALAAWIATLLLAAAALGAMAGRLTPSRARHTGWVAVATGVLVAALLGQAP